MVEKQVGWMENTQNDWRHERMRIQLLCECAAVCFGSHNNKSIIHGEYFAELAAAWLGLHYDSLSVKHMAKKEDGQKTKKKSYNKKRHTYNNNN